MARRSQDIYTEWRGGTCRVKWWSGEYHASGRKRFESEGGFTDEDEAYDHGRDKLYEIRHGTNISNRDGATLVSDWLDDWLASLDLAHLSVRNYTWTINSHIRPFFDRKTVKEIDILTVRAFRRHLAKTLSDNSVRNVMMVFNMVMNDAVDAGLRKTSPVEQKRRRGKFKKKKRERKKDMPVEVVDQLARNAETVFGYSGYVFMWTMAMTGMRPAELYGLTREYCHPNWPASDPRPDPDEGDRYEEDAERYGKGEGVLPAIRVQRQVQYEDGELGFFPPKYDSYRTLVIPQFLADMLEKLLASHDEEWVFTGIEGGCLARLAFNREYWRPVANGCEERSGGRVLKPRAEIPAVPSFQGKRMYLIRHGHKAWLDEDGHSRFAVESRMGHEMQGVEGTYSNVTPAMERAIVASLQARWERLPQGAAVDVGPRPMVPSVAQLVRGALTRGIKGTEAVLAEVRLACPDARRDTVVRTVARVANEQSEAA
ncbi:phage integrase SAM-like domain-containing protein [Streptomyces sp. E11-3]|uniref:tyrosine-type recombinase/integrase n=1 Tax=Streptomyces sp. E11-3 TaxID=3110112 RepID=UPI0039813584